MSTLLGTVDIGFQNFYSSNLTSDITAVSTDIFIDTVPSVSEGILVIDPDSAANREVIYYSSKTGTKVVCPAAGRGYDNSTATTHTTGTKVIMAPVADYFYMLRNASVLGASPRSGWTPGNGTWTYASATTITVPQADADAITTGTKIWLDQSGSKWFYATGVSGTTVTVTAGSDYTVANAAIASPYFSQAASPKGFPANGFAYTPTYTNWTIGTGGSAGTTARFRMTGKWVEGDIFSTLGSSGQSVGTGVTYSLPVTSEATANVLRDIGIATLRAGGATTRNGHAVHASTTTGGINQWDVNNDNGTLTASSPGVWAAGDWHSVHFKYRAA